MSESSSSIQFLFTRPNCDNHTQRMNEWTKKKRRKKHQSYRIIRQFECVGSYRNLFNISRMNAVCVCSSQDWCLMCTRARIHTHNKSNKLKKRIETKEEKKWTINIIWMIMPAFFSALVKMRWWKKEIHVHSFIFSLLCLSLLLLLCLWWKTEQLQRHSWTSDRIDMKREPLP